MSELSVIPFIKSYWNYYLELENQFVSTQSYVDFSEINNHTFSVEYLKLIQAVCSEIDVVAKIIAESIDPKFKNGRNKNIQQWGLVIQNHFDNIEGLTVIFNGDYSVKPWKYWKYEEYIDKNGSNRIRLVIGKKTPDWWTAYNKIKHERTTLYQNNRTNYSRANLKNLVLSFSALFSLETVFISYLKENENFESIIKDSRIFTLINSPSQI